MYRNVPMLECMQSQATESCRNRSATFPDGSIRNTRISTQRTHKIYIVSNSWCSLSILEYVRLSNCSTLQITWIHLHWIQLQVEQKSSSTSSHKTDSKSFRGPLYCASGSLVEISMQFLQPLSHRGKAILDRKSRHAGNAFK